MLWWCCRRLERWVDEYSALGVGAACAFVDTSELIPFDELDSPLWDADGLHMKAKGCVDSSARPPPPASVSLSHFWGRMDGRTDGG